MSYEILNRLKWAGGLEGCEITVIHRGGKGNRKTISGLDVTEVKKSYFSYRTGKGETTIPLHRVLQISMEGKVLWERKRK